MCTTAATNRPIGRVKRRRAKTLVIGPLYSLLAVDII